MSHECKGNISREEVGWCQKHYRSQGMFAKLHITWVINTESAEGGNNCCFVALGVPGQFMSPENSLEEQKTDCNGGQICGPLSQGAAKCQFYS